MEGGEIGSSRISTDVITKFNNDIVFTLTTSFGFDNTAKLNYKFTNFGDRVRAPSSSMERKRAMYTLDRMQEINHDLTCRGGIFHFPGTSAG